MKIWYFSIGVFCAMVAGKSIGGVFRALSETLDKAGTAKGNGSTRATSTVTTLSSPSKPTAKPVPIRKPVDPLQVTEGLDRSELIKRFGEPVLQLSERSNSELVERLWYNTTTSDQLEIKLIGGKVASVPPPASKTQAEGPSLPTVPWSPAP